MHSRHGCKVLATQPDPVQCCCWCFHQGHVVKKRERHAQVYEVKLVQKRTHGNFEMFQVCIVWCTSDQIVDDVFLALLTTLVDCLHAVQMFAEPQTFDSNMRTKAAYLWKKKSPKINMRLKKENVTTYSLGHSWPLYILERIIIEGVIPFYSPFVLNGLLPP